MKRPEGALAIPAGEPNVPAMAEHDAIMEDARSAQRRGFLALAAGAALATASTGIAAWVVTRRGPPVQIADVCRGDVIAVRTAELAPTRPKLEDIAEDLNRWVRGAREITVDQTLWRRELDRTYAMTRKASQAQEILSAYHRRVQPNEAAREKTVKIDQQTALPASGNVLSNTWNLEWREVARKRDGTLLSVTFWKMEVTFDLSPPPDNAEDLQKNIHGIYVMFFSWKQVPPPTRARIAEAQQ